ncbi:MAG TPA: GPP34 family phosphoprotein [Actinospica sp.]|jgi:hypothetical protein|nr:GPP34 family phosphoprotein [Actinospica sp.]
MGLGSELAILAIDSKSGRPRFSADLAYSLAAADLVEMVLNGRIQLRADHDADADPAPASAPSFGILFANLRMSKMRTVIPTWLAERGPKAINKHVDELVASGAITLKPILVGPGESKQAITVHDPDRFATAEQRLQAACAPAADPTFEDLAFAVLANTAKCASPHLHGWSNRAQRRRLDELTQSVDALVAPAAQFLAVCIASIRELAHNAPKRPGDNRSLDQQIGLTRTGRDAALYWGR